MKTYRFYLEPYTFLWEKKSKACIYNSLSGQRSVVDIKPSVRHIIDAWQDTDNLYCAELSEEEMINSDVKELIDNVQEVFCGDITEASPVVLPAYMNFQMDRQRLTDLNGNINRQFGDRIISNLLELSLYICSDCSLSCPHCSIYCKHALCCTKMTTGGVLSPQQTEQLLLSTRNSSIKHINILGGDLFSLPSISDYTDVLNKFSYIKNYYSHYFNVNDKAKLLGSRDNLKLFVPAPVDAVRLQECVRIISNIEATVYWIFFIANEAEYELAETVIEQQELLRVRVIPYYNGCNESFLADCLFMNAEDVSKIYLNRRQIYSHQYVNSGDFGKLTVTSDGKVYANLNHQPLGLIGDDIKDLIFKELNEGLSWLRTRRETPCSDCLFQWLCPSPTNYEILLNRPNLCNLNT